MTLFHILLLALVQGITEFLPISSSAHLILLPQALGAADQGQVVDVAVHVGTLGAVVVYFWRDVALAIGGFLRLLTGRTDGWSGRLALGLVVSTIPVVLAGLVLNLTGLDAAMRSIAVIGWTMILFGLLLWWVDLRVPEVREAEGWTLRDALVMGLWQAVALIPGTSRSGITITAGRMLAYRREDAARLAMLMSIPTILASGLLVGAEAWGEGNPALLRAAGLAALLAFAAALAALAVMMRLARRISFTPYVIYRVVLGVVLLAIAYT